MAEWIYQSMAGTCYDWEIELGNGSLIRAFSELILHGFVQLQLRLSVTWDSVNRTKGWECIKSPSESFGNFTPLIW